MTPAGLGFEDFFFKYNLAILGEIVCESFCQVNRYGVGIFKICVICANVHIRIHSPCWPHPVHLAGEFSRKDSWVEEDVYL